MAGERPRYQPAWGPGDIVLTGISGAIWLTTAVAVAFSWPGLPDKIPMHFDFAGNPNRWGPRLELLIPLAISALLFVGLSILARYPHIYNYTVEITAENAPQQYRLAVRMIRTISLLIQAIFGGVIWVILRAAKGLPPPHPWLVPLLVAMIFASLIVYLMRVHSTASTRRSP